MLDKESKVLENASQMATSWQELEAKVRQIASLIWSQPCSPEEIAGVKIDGVLKLKPNYWVLIEITERTDLLHKLREDLAKFSVVVPYLLSKRIFAECFFVMDKEPPESIPKSAKDADVVACSIETFANRFFDFGSYHASRKEKTFGSSFNPIEWVIFQSLTNTKIGGLSTSDNFPICCSMVKR